MLPLQLSWCLKWPVLRMASSAIKLTTSAIAHSPSVGMGVACAAEASTAGPPGSVMVPKVLSLSPAPPSVKVSVMDLRSLLMTAPANAYQCGTALPGSGPNFQ